MPDYSNKVDRILDHCGDLEPADFLLLAQAALDQVGVPLVMQDQVADLLGLELLTLLPRHNYRDTESNDQ